MEPSKEDIKRALGLPTDATEEQLQRALWHGQYARFFWGPGDIQIIRRAADPQKGTDDGVDELATEPSEQDR